MAKFVPTTVFASLGFPAIYNRLETELGLYEGRRQDFFFCINRSTVCSQTPNPKLGFLFGVSSALHCQFQAT